MNPKDIKVFILAAGLGTRLGDLTRDKPKPMMDINGKPFLEYMLNNCHEQGFNNIVLCVGYKHEVITQYFGNGEKFGLNINYSIGKKPLGTAGEIKHAQKFIDNTFIVMNGDTFSDMSLKKIIEYHKEKKSNITIACTKSNNEGRSGGINITQYKLITSFDEKIEKSYINSGIYVLEPNIKELLNTITSEEISFEKDIFPKKISEKKIFAYVTDKPFTDIGIIESLEKFRNL
jgi:NDP-sugar pyrophosphorylase family protein